uniref:Zinc finger CCCH domain-containing protein 7B-like n=1 Tax=Sinocyclocheilus anshuiensis TaxID=1608454 RepID=A0A671NHR8_9TELE
VTAMDLERQKRKEEIQKALGFIQSSLAFFSQAFLTQLVCNLLDEGNAVYRDGEWRPAAVHYSEGVNVARYAQSEALVIPPELLESLYVNRAAAQYSLGEYERGVQDCDSALCVSEGSRRALYRKALCLRELGRFREAYECGTGCLLTAPHDRQVSELAQDLANKLGLKIRKAYVSPQVCFLDFFFITFILLFLLILGGRMSHSFIPSLRNHNASNAVSLNCSVLVNCSVLLNMSSLYATLNVLKNGLLSITYSKNCSCFQQNGPVGTNLSLLSRNPLAATHEFRQACNACYSRIGPRVMDYHYQPDAAHRCKRDVLLCRLKSSDDPTWKRVRPRPARNNFLGAFVLCKEVQERQECQYGENCTFAYCQEEIDVWTQERKGALSRELLFDPLGTNERRALSVTRLLQLHMGMFMFLCEECFDSKPRIISKRSKENLAVCSNLTARHPFDDNKCLVHVVRSANVRYSKVRPLHPLCQFDVCRHEVRYGCQREDSCSFAHSVIELKCWVLQQDTGITHEEMVQESKRHWHRLEQNAQRQKMKFVCGQCWREGQVNEPDKSLKYCTAKARHSWTKERRVLLVKSFEKKKWVVVRPLPFSRTYPQQYDMCVHVMKQKKCHYIGNCSFAHSLEERDVWTYMKNNSLRDMQQMYEMWLSLTNQNRRADSNLMTSPSEEKQIAMPTDYSESMVGGCRRKWFVCVIKWKALSFLNCIIRFICALFDRLGDGCLVVEGICDLGLKVCGYRRSG